MCLIVFFGKSMSGACLWFDTVLFLVLSSCPKSIMVGGTSRKEKKYICIYVYAFIYAYMENGITILRKQSQLLFFIVIIIIIIIFVYLVG